MLNNHDDVKDFDQRVMKLRSMLDAPTNDKIECDVMRLMQDITWHDWTTDCPFPPYVFESLRRSDEILVSKFTDACVIFLDKPGEKDVPELRMHADEYLQKRGLKVNVEPIVIKHDWHNDYFQVSELARMRKAVKLPCSATTMTREIDKEIANDRIRRDGNKPMRLRMDLYTEWNTQLR